MLGARNNIKTNVTSAFRPYRLYWRKSWWTYISPFVGRLDDISTEGMELIRQIVHIYDEYGLIQKCWSQVFARKHAESALAGAHVATIPFGAAARTPPLTGGQVFTDWEKVPKS